MEYGDKTLLKAEMKQQHDKQLHELERTYIGLISKEQHEQQTSRDEKQRLVTQEFKRRERQQRQQIREYHEKQRDVIEQEYSRKILEALYKQLSQRLKKNTPLETSKKYISRIRKVLSSLDSPTVKATSKQFEKPLGVKVTRTPSITGVKVQTTHSIYDFTLERFFEEHEREIYTLVQNTLK